VNSFFFFYTRRAYGTHYLSAKTCLLLPCVPLFPVVVLFPQRPPGMLPFSDASTPHPNSAPLFYLNGRDSLSRGSQGIELFFHFLLFGFAVLLFPVAFLTVPFRLRSRQQSQKSRDIGITANHFLPFFRSLPAFFLLFSFMPIGYYNISRPLLAKALLLNSACLSLPPI